MRNLKRVLSLALALVMMLGMMIITTSAAEATTVDFADADEITNTEAVDVMSALGVLEGDGTNYNPAKILTRAEATTIIAKMLLGPANVKLLAGSSNFTDTQGHWADAYIAYCTSLNIIAGNGDGTFDPEGKLTGVAFAKMLLAALGYDPKVEGYVNDANWATNIGGDAISAGIAKRGTNLAGEVSRDTAALMAFNTLEATLVEYTNATEIKTPDGTSITINAVCNDVEWQSGEVVYNNNADGYVQFCEEYFPLLRRTGSHDFFGNDSTLWTNMGVKIGNYTEEPTITYTSDLNNAAGKKAIKADIKGFNNYDDADYVFAGGDDIDVYEYGVRADLDTYNAGTATAEEGFIASLTGNGRTVNIYTNINNEITNIVVIQDLFSKVTAKNSKTGELTISVNNGAASVKTELGFDDFEKDDLVIVRVIDDNKTLDNTNTEVIEIYEPTVVVGTGTKATLDNSGNTASITVDGVEYEVGADCWTSATSFSVDAKKTAKLYLDEFGYVKHAISIGSTPVNVMAVTRYYQTLVDGEIAYMVSGVGIDGEAKTIRTNTDQSAVGVEIVSYVDTGAGGDIVPNDGIYTIADVTSASAISSAVTTGVTTGTGTYTGNGYAAFKTNASTSEFTKTDMSQTLNSSYKNYYADDVKFMFINTTYKTVTVRTGAQDVATGQECVVIYKVNPNDGLSYITAVFVYDVPVVSTTNSSDVVFVMGGATGTVALTDANGISRTFYTYDAYVDGEKVEDFYSAQSIEANGFYMIDKKQNGDYDLTNAYTDTSAGNTYAVSPEFTVKSTGGETILSSAAKDYNVANAVFVDTTRNNISSVSDINHMGDLSNKVNVVVMYNADTGAASYVYVTSVVNTVTGKTVTGLASTTYNSTATVAVAVNKDYANTGDVVTFTLTLGGTSNATTDKVLTFAGVTLTDGTLTGTGVSGVTSVVISGNNTVTITPTAAATTGTYTFTGVVTGNVTVSG